MPNQADLDQGGTFRAWISEYLGPSVGWTYGPQNNVFPITLAGTYAINPNINTVTVNVNGVVTITLPSAVDPLVPAGTLPGLFINNSITIVDTGGFAGAHPITIQPFSVSENIAGLSSIQITTNYGGLILAPNSALKGWNSI